MINYLKSQFTNIAYFKDCGYFADTCNEVIKGCMCRFIHVIIKQEDICMHVFCQNNLRDAFYIAEKR